jgi:hypothetical protein
LLEQRDAPRSAQQRKVLYQSKSRLVAERAGARIELLRPSELTPIPEMGCAIQRDRLAHDPVRLVGDGRMSHRNGGRVAARQHEECHRQCGDYDQD